MKTLPLMEWSDIPAGPFLYGHDKQPRTLPAFRIATYLVTYEEFQIFLDDLDGYTNPAWWAGLNEAAHRQRQRGPREQQYPMANHPRENVSWYEAMAYCGWLSERLGCAVSLPTEEQWEKAARGPSGLVYPFGDEWDTSKCNCCPTGADQTVPVDAYPEVASPYGVMDMAANVREWTLSEFVTGENAGSGSNARRVIRGGSFRNKGNVSQSYFRLSYNPVNRYFAIGFRLAAAVS
jgi:formylglycine-generating enzyme required for sulfatase activity